MAKWSMLRICVFERLLLCDQNRQAASLKACIHVSTYFAHELLSHALQENIFPCKPPWGNGQHITSVHASHVYLTLETQISRMHHAGQPEHFGTRFPVGDRVAWA